MAAGPSVSVSFRISRTAHAAMKADTAAAIATSSSSSPTTAYSVPFSLFHPSCLASSAAVPTCSGLPNHWRYVMLHQRDSCSCCDWLRILSIAFGCALKRGMCCFHHRVISGWATPAKLLSFGFLSTLVRRINNFDFNSNTQNSSST